VRHAVDHESAGPANPFTTIVIEGYWFFTFRRELLIEDIQHLQE
jgi:hypothetical protein